VVKREIAANGCLNYQVQASSFNAPDFLFTKLCGWYYEVRLGKADYLKGIQPVSTVLWLSTKVGLHKTGFELYQRMTSAVLIKERMKRVFVR
jgi:hypothetical protein